MGILFGEMGIDWDWEYGAKPRYHVTPGKGKMGVLGDEKRQKAHCYAVCCICCRREKEKAGDRYLIYLMYLSTLSIPLPYLEVLTQLSLSLSLSLPTWYLYLHVTYDIFK